MPKGARLKTIVTAFDELYFQRFGVGWFSSLAEAGRYKGKIIAVAFSFGMNSSVDKMRSMGIDVVHAKTCEDMRSCVIGMVLGMQKSNPGTYAYFDIDGHFEGDINPLFDISSDSELLVSENGDSGMVCGDEKAWGRLGEYRKFESFCGFGHSTGDFANMNRFVKLVPNKWNYTSPTRVSEEPDVRFVHYSGQMKSYKKFDSMIDSILTSKNPELMSKWRSELLGQHGTAIQKPIFPKRKANDPADNPDLG
jgi:hypothetical protein